MTWKLSAMAIGALALLTGGCQKTDNSMNDKLDRIDERMGKMEKHLAALSSARGAGAAKRRERPRPKPQLTYSVPVNGAPFVGPADAPVTIVEGFEFACGWCEKSRSLVKEVLADYKGKVRLVHKNYLIHPETATAPALAACAANKQGKFASMEPLIWDKGFKARKFDAAHMRTLAAEVGLDLDRYDRDVKGAECMTQLRRDQKELAAVGVAGTPAFFINGRWLPRRSKAEFKRLIDEELAKAEKRIADGTSPASYYADWVVKKGKKTI